MENEGKEEEMLPISPAVKAELKKLVIENPFMQELNMEILEIERG